MNCHVKPAELLQGPISPRLGILLSSFPSPGLLTNQPDKQRLFQSILQPTRVSQKPRHFVSTVKVLNPVTFCEQIAERLQPSPQVELYPPSVPQDVREKVLSRVRCLQQVIERLPRHFCPYRATPEYKVTYYVETLACGHKVFSFPQAGRQTAKRRNCAECVRSQSFPEMGAPVVSSAGGSVRGNAVNVPLPPFASSEKKPVQSATESEVITDVRNLG